MSESKPPITGTEHVLPFDRLSPADFERLCLWLVEREGYERAEHLGAAGKEQGRDIVAYKPAPHGRELWCFQCKRYRTINSKTLKDEVDKYLRLVQEKPYLQPVGVVFALSCAASAKVREEVGAYCDRHGLAYEFWALTELDMRVKRHADVLQEFFNFPASVAVDKGAALTNRLSRLLQDVYQEWRKSGRFLIHRDELIPLSEYAETATLCREESLFMLQAALHFGINVIGWTRRNRNDPSAVEVAINAVRGPYWRTRWRAALALLEMDAKLVQRSIEQALGGGDLDEDAALALRNVRNDTVVEYLRAVANGALGDVMGGKARDILWQMGIDIEPTAFAQEGK